MSRSGLGLDADELVACVSCGLCLAHCPTYRATGEEALSPRGRIAAMRAVEAGSGVDDAFVHMMDTCVQCRACETACPSSVHFGHLMETARAAIAPTAVPRRQRWAYGLLGRPRLLRALTTVGGVAQWARLVPASLAARLSLPKLPVRQSELRATGEDVWLFTGCVMDAWQRPVHQAAIDVLGAMGFGVALPGPAAACCGALHVHAGLDGDARRLARRVIGAFPGERPVLVDSAGCGAALKEYGRLLGTDEAHRFAGRVRDIHEWMAEHADQLPAPVASVTSGAGVGSGSDAGSGSGAGAGASAGSGAGVPAPGRRLRVAIQDPCHLRHVQRAERHVRTVLAPYAELVELTDEGRCCGAGGAYSALHPSLAGVIRDQKVSVIEAAGADVVASANPGCAMWLAAGGVPVRHPVEIIARAAGLERR